MMQPGRTPKLCFAATAAILVGACSSGGGGDSAAAPAPADHPFRYEVPSPPTATYRLADTITTVMIMPDGEMEMAQSSSSTVALTFAADSGGVLASGTVSDYSQRMSSAMFGDMEMGGNEVTGDIEFIVGPLGNVEMVSTPEIAGADLPMAIPFQFNAADLFPRFPGHALEPGDTWADTTSESADMGASGMPGADALTATAENTTVYTYSLVGDTVVDGRTFQKITVSAVGTMQASGDEAGEAISQNMTNTVEGFVLWDADRRLVAVAELVRTADGTMSMMGMTMAMTMAGPSRIRLVN